MDRDPSYVLYLIQADERREEAATNLSATEQAQERLQGCHAALARATKEAVALAKSARDFAVHSEEFSRAMRGYFAQGSAVGGETEELCRAFMTVIAAMQPLTQVAACVADKIPDEIVVPLRTIAKDTKRVANTAAQAIKVQRKELASIDKAKLLCRNISRGYRSDSASRTPPGVVRNSASLSIPSPASKPPSSSSASSSGDSDAVHQAIIDFDARANDASAVIAERSTFVRQEEKAFLRSTADALSSFTQHLSTPLSDLCHARKRLIPRSPTITTTTGTAKRSRGYYHDAQTAITGSPAVSPGRPVLQRTTEPQISSFYDIHAHIPTPTVAV